MTPNIVALLRSQDKPMPIDRLDPDYRASVDRARGDLITFRLRHGLNPNPEAPIAEVHPAALIAIMPQRVTVAPLRMALEPDQLDRTATLAVKVDELIEQGYSPAEIRRHLDLVDAANEEDY